MTRNIVRRFSTASLALLAFPAVADADLRMVRPEQQQTLVGGNAHANGLAATSSGYFLVQVQQHTDNNPCPVLGQLLDQDGNVTSEFPVRETPLPFCSSVPGDVAVTSGGHLIAAGFGPYDFAEETFSVEMRVLDATGIPISPTIEVSDVANSSFGPQVVATEGGGFAVAWGEDDETVHVQQFDASGSATGAEYVESNTRYHGWTIAPRSGGGIVLAWRMEAGEFMTSADVVRFRPVNAAGAAVGAFVDVSQPGPRQALALEALPGGGFLLLSTLREPRPEPNGLENLYTLFGRILDSSFSGGSDIVIRHSRTWGIDNIGASRRSDGRFLAIWNEYDGRASVFGQELDSSGVPIGEPLVTINSDRIASVALPLVASSATAERSLVVWRGYSDSVAYLLGRSICDPADLDCPICLGVPDMPDTDADGIPDGCDPCVGIGDERVLTDSKLRVAADVDGPSEIMIKGELVLDANAPAFDQFALDTVGGRLRVEGKLGGLILDAALTAQASAMPGLEGWSAGGSGRLWRYFGDNGYFAPYKLGRLTLREKARDGQRVIRFKAIGDGVIYPYPFLEEDLPLRVTIELGGLGGPQVTCGELNFEAEECRYRERNEIRCSF